jgi:acetyl-CoA acetyltransferase
MVLIFVSVFVLIKLRERKDKKSDIKEEALRNFYISQYGNKLEAYLDITRKAVLAYDISNHDPKIAVVALESMKINMANMAVHLIKADPAERVVITETIKKVRSMV